MRVLFAGNKDRGVVCLQALVAHGYDVVGVLAHAAEAQRPVAGSVVAVAQDMGLPLFQPPDINAPSMLARLRVLQPEMTVLAGYGHIVSQAFIDIAPLGCINLHAGKLPQYRGSSPMNWALINGETAYTLSIIQVDTGVDTGDVLSERTFPIAADDTIADLQDRANQIFPDMLLDVLSQCQAGTMQRRKQDDTLAGYYPRRFPDDGLILWDLHTAWQIHNRIRALTDPYPGAFTFFEGQRVRLGRSKLTRRTYYGEPGRVYLKNEHGLLVCATDCCLWVQRAVFEGSNTPAFDVVGRYQKFATLRHLATASLAWVEGEKRDR